MSENRSENSKRSSNSAVDLNSLSSLSFGPDWTADSKSAPKKPAGTQQRSGSSSKKDFSKTEPRRDRRTGHRRKESMGSGAKRDGDFRGLSGLRVLRLRWLQLKWPYIRRMMFSML